MKHTLPILLTAALAAACNGGNGTTAGQQDNDTTTAAPVLESAEVQGTIGSGSTMNVLELILSSGDTLHVSIPTQMVIGGATVGNEADVVYTPGDGEPVGHTAVNTTALRHMWSRTADDGTLQSLEIDNGGRAISYSMTADYSSWSISGGYLLLQSARRVGDEKPLPADTFQIMMLSEDSLVLMSPNATDEIKYWRDN